MTALCKELAWALTRHGTPDVNTDQGYRSTADEFTLAVLAGGCHSSMEGKGAWPETFPVERLWRTIKYDRVYWRALAI